LIKFRSLFLAPLQPFWKVTMGGDSTGHGVVGILIDFLCDFMDYILFDVKTWLKTH